MTRNFDLGITADYQAHSWGLEQASREFIANALDAQARGEGLCSVDHLPRSKQLRITTCGVTLDPSVLLLGTSGSRDRSDCIGTFGEGLPMAITTMCRLARDHEDMDFEIDNGQDRWKPTIEWSDKWAAEVVTVKVRQRRQHQPEDFTVTLKGIDTETFHRLRDRFLALDPEFDSDRTCRPHGESDRVLLQPEFKGRLYVKGVLVKHRDDLSYGYDLDMDLNRDRSFVDEYELRYRLQRLMASLASQEDGKITPADIAGMIESPDNRLEFDGFSTWRLRESPALVDATVQRFEEKHGADAVPCKNMSEARDLEAVGKKPAVLPPAMREIVEMRKGTAAEALEGASSVPQAIHQWADLSDVQRSTLEDVAALVGMAFLSESDVLAQVQIVTFTDRKQLGSYDPKTNQICLDLAILEDFNQTLKTLAHEVAHQLPGAKDGSMEHGEAQVDILADIICNTFR